MDMGKSIKTITRKIKNGGVALRISVTLHAGEEKIYCLNVFY